MVAASEEWAVHEMAIASAILDKSIDLIENKSCKLGSVRVQIGEFRNVDPESLQFAFDILKKENQITASADLLMEMVQSEALCSGGGHRYHPEAASYYCCSHCGGGVSSFIHGKELDIVGVEPL